MDKTIGVFILLITGASLLYLFVTHVVIAIYNLMKLHHKLKN